MKTSQLNYYEHHRTSIKLLDSISWLWNDRADIFCCYCAYLIIYSPVTGQRHTLIFGRSAHFSLRELLRAWGNRHLLRSSSDPKLLWISSNFCPKPPSRDNHRKTAYLFEDATTWLGCGLNRDHVIRIVVKRCFCPLGHTFVIPWGLKRLF